MAHVLLIAGWIFAILCMAALACDVFRARRAKRSTPVVRERRRWLRRWQSIENEPTQSVLEAIDASAAETDFKLRPWIRPAGFIAFLLWEAFWISEIFERSSQTDRPLQLPYVFLFIMMVGIPAAAYFLSRKWLAADREEV